jgi:hypothetical protein
LVDGFASSTRASAAGNTVTCPELPPGVGVRVGDTVAVAVPTGVVVAVGAGAPEPPTETIS